LWFEEEADICIPTDVLADKARVAKYRLTRAVLIQHFSRTINEGGMHTARFSFVFPSLQSRLFCEYLDTYPFHFFLGSNAYQDEAADAGESTSPLQMTYLIASAGYCVAFIKDIAYRSSKVQYRPTTAHILLNCSILTYN
jgi:hypothetical protein